MKPVRWGMLSTAGIGRVVAAALRSSPHAELVAVGRRDAERAWGSATGTAFCEFL
ncbi:hypothetical protein [Streptomyces sp. NPDC097640]|uniref:hypothetical protein n=1 Tax=Streptomyces sp. NPDC097640 TaxID=3157229 RepID=UPI0033249AC2